MIHIHNYITKKIEFPGDLTDERINDIRTIYSSNSAKSYEKFIIPLGTEYKECSKCGKIKKIK